MFNNLQSTNAEISISCNKIFQSIVNFAVRRKTFGTETAMNERVLKRYFWYFFMSSVSFTFKPYDFSEDMVYTTVLKLKVKMF